MDNPYDYPIDEVVEQDPPADTGEDDYQIEPKEPEHDVKSKIEEL